MQHRDMADEENGALTIKLYSSKKVAAGDGEWRHQRITLSLDSLDPAYRPIVLKMDASTEPPVVVAEWLMTL